jgi:hypothetical protein
LILLGLAALLLVPKIYFEKWRRSRRGGREAPLFKGKFNIPRPIAVCRVLRQPMNPGDVAEWHDEFHPN